MVTDKLSEGIPMNWKLCFGCNSQYVGGISLFAMVCALLFTDADLNHLFCFQKFPFLHKFT